MGKKEGKMKSGAFRSEARESFWIWTWIFLTVTTICHFPGAHGKLECDPDSNGPCFCHSDNSEISVLCSGYAPLNNTYINNFFTKLRDHNGLKATDTLELDSFELQYFNLTTFDLTPLFRTKINHFDINGNSKLTGFSGSDTGTGTIAADILHLKFNAITTEGLDGIFKLFNGLSVEQIELDYNKLMGVPDLSTLQSLQYLNLNSNEISELKAGSFRSLTNLRDLTLTNNPVDYVRESAFLIDPPTTNEDLSIDLEFTNLKSAGFSPKSGIDKIKKDVFLSIGQHFDSLPQDVFLPFLEANPNNGLNLQRNTELQCDSRVKWLQDRQNEFKNRVVEAKCSNDPGQTVWNSKKVKGDLDNSGWSVGTPGPAILISLGFILFYTMYFSK